MKYFKLAIICIIIILVCSCNPVSGWSNGGFSDDSLNPEYGTHDWLAQHALELLPEKERQFLSDNLQLYLYGTELPDNPFPADGIGDRSKHHVYLFANGSLQDDSSARRANEMYLATLQSLRDGDHANASKSAGAMTHYISDVAVFGHVMANCTDWGEEEHHSDYEGYIQRRTTNFTSPEFDPYIVFDGKLEFISAYNATVEIAYDTTCDSDGEGHTCSWMDANYNWSDPAFKDESGESLNFAVNKIADVLHSLYWEFRIRNALRDENWNLNTSATSLDCHEVLSSLEEAQQLCSNPYFKKRGEQAAVSRCIHPRCYQP